ncbi:MAG: hypothetical protein HOW97_08735 [Catenulispora sp.]|nr:hypothetical protein [Catenulispora sp.]
MHIELDPPNGVTGFGFGMPVEELKEAAAALGPITVTDEGPPSKWRHMKIYTQLDQFDILFSSEDGKTLTSLDIARPYEDDADVTVTWRGIDVFRTPARELMERIEAQGYRVDHRERFNPLVPGLSFGLDWNPRDDIPFDGDIDEDDDAMPVYLRGIFVAPAVYYDEVLAEIAAMGL